MAVTQNLIEVYNCYTLKELAVLYDKYNAVCKKLRESFDLKNAKADWNTYLNIMDKLDSIENVVIYKCKENNV